VLGNAVCWTKSSWIGVGVWDVSEARSILNRSSLGYLCIEDKKTSCMLPLCPSYVKHKSPLSFSNDILKERRERPAMRIIKR